MVAFVKWEDFQSPDFWNIALRLAQDYNSEDSGHFLWWQQGFLLPHVWMLEGEVSRFLGWFFGARELQHIADWCLHNNFLEPDYNLIYIKWPVSSPRRYKGKKMSKDK